MTTQTQARVQTVAQGVVSITLPSGVEHVATNRNGRWLAAPRGIAGTIDVTHIIHDHAALIAKLSAA